MAGAGEVEGAVIQALRYLGAGQISAGTIELLREALTARQRSALRRGAFSAPGWLVPILLEIARPETTADRSDAPQARTLDGPERAG